MMHRGGIVIIFIIVLNLTSQESASVSLNSASYAVTIDLNEPVHIVDSRFLSVTIDTGLIREKFSGYDVENERLITLVKALEPVYVRVGGTSQDFLTFVLDGKFHESNGKFHESNGKFHESNGKFKDFDGKFQDIDGNNQDSLANVEDYDEWLELNKKIEKKFNMTGEDLDRILKFIIDTNSELIFGLNVLKRKGSEWDYENAKVLLDYVNKRDVLVHWELGNEPPFEKFNVSISHDQLYHDFKSLRKLLYTFPRFRKSLLIGPDIGEFVNKEKKLIFYDKFIKHATPVLDVETLHQYYTNSRTATISDFIDPNLLDDLKLQIDTFVKISRNYSPDKPLWFGETSSTFGGGTPGLSDRYVAGFMWLDKLGLSATHGMEVVMRQSLFKGHYALLSDDDFKPNPDYWLSLLFKALVGETVLNVKPEFQDNSIRVYCHCTSDKAPYNSGSIVLYAMNLLKTDVEINDDSVRRKLASTDIRVGNSVDQFVFTPPGGNLTSRSVLLNGQELKMPDERTLPSVKPLSTDRIVLPGLSFGFFVLKNVRASACS